MAPLKGAASPAKALLRAEVSARLAELSNDEKRRQSKIIYDKVTSHPWYRSASRIALYMSTDTEVDTWSLLDEAQARGAVPFVPQYAGGHMKMLRVLRGDAANMATTKHGIAQHADGEVREDAVETGGLDLVIAPGLAFTKCGRRLGHGGGYYDRFLAGLLERHRADPARFLKPNIVALAFKEQLLEDLAVDDHDVPVDLVLSAD